MNGQKSICKEEDLEFSFDEKYFEDEERCGFKVSSLMKRCWASQLNVLSEFDAVCSRHGLKWFAFCGTLLGAVRHGGFIPWDDDMDVCMLRPDYDRFLMYAKTEMKDYLVETYDYNDREKKRYNDFMGITRINNTHKADFSEDFLKANYGFPYTVGLDVYPLDYLPRDKGTMDLVYQVFAYSINVGFKYKSMYWEGYTAPPGNYADIDLDSAYEALKNATGVKIDKNGDVPAQLNALAEKVASLTQSKDSDNVACLSHLIMGHTKLIFPKDAFRSRLSMPFESGEIYVPYGYEQVLKINYGKNFINPVNRSPHDYPYYKLQERWVVDHIIKNPDLKDIITDYYLSDVYDEDPEKKALLDNIYGKEISK